MAALTKKRSIASFDRDLGTLITFPSRKLVQNAIQEKHYKKGFTATDETIYHIRFKMDDDYFGHKERIEHNLSKCAFLKLPRELRERIWKQYFEDNYDPSNGVIPILHVSRLMREECFLLFVNRYQPKSMSQTHYVRWKTFQDPGAGIKAPTIFLLDKNEKVTGFQMSFIKSPGHNTPRIHVHLDYFCVNSGVQVQVGLNNIEPGMAAKKPAIVELTRSFINGVLFKHPGHMSLALVEAVFTYAANAVRTNPNENFGSVRWADSFEL